MYIIVQHDYFGSFGLAYGRLGDVVGSLVIAQFDDQEEYREVIHELFRGWLQSDEVSS